MCDLLGLGRCPGGVAVYTDDKFYCGGVTSSRRCRRRRRFSLTLKSIAHLRLASAPCLTNERAEIFIVPCEFSCVRGAAAARQALARNDV